MAKEVNSLPIKPKKSNLQPSLVQAIAPVLLVVLAQAVFIGVSAIVGRLTSPLYSLVSLAFIAVGALLVLYVPYGRRLLGKKALLIIGIAFLTRLVVGCIHYLTLMDPEYFSNPTAFSYLWDFQWFHESLQLVSGHWQADGFLAPLPDAFSTENKNAVLLAYCAIGFYCSGEFVLTMAVWNSLHSIYTAFLIAALARHLGADRRQGLFALAFVAFQPYGMISSMMARDFIGQTWMVIAVYLVIVLIKWRVLWLLSIPVAGVLAMSMREPYLIVILVGAGLVFTLRDKRPVGARILILAIVGAAIASSQLGAMLGDASFSRFTESDGYGIRRILGLPFRLVRAVMGPFPWDQVFDDPPPSGVEFMPVTFLQVIFNLSLLLVVVPRIWKRLMRENTVDIAVPFGVILYLTGAIATGVHQTYITIGIIFLLPVACRARPVVWRKCIAVSVAFFLLANGVYMILGLRGSGILKEISGGY